MKSGKNILFHILEGKYIMSKFKNKISKDLIIIEWKNLSGTGHGEVLGAN